jgi:hypothetical protein
MRKVKIPKGGGRFRTIYVPSREERDLMRRFALPGIVKLLSHKQVAGVIHGFTRGRSPVTNALQHRDFQFTLSMDLKDFFDTVTPEMVPEVDEYVMKPASAFDKMHFFKVPPNAAVTIPQDIVQTSDEVIGGAVWRMFCYPTIPMGLAAYHIGRRDVSRGEKVHLFPDGAARQGLPTSPAIANLAACPMDKIIDKHIKSRSENIVYTRYADDMCLSFDNHDTHKYLITVIRDAVSSCGFEINERKTRLQSSSAGRRIITGVGVDSDGLYPTRALKRKLRAAIHQQHKNSARGLAEVTKLKVPRQWDGDGDSGGHFWDGVWSRLGETM